uniref:Uncharacterized protein n=1 Tax=Glossina palpalis gambiensis TaxID=67801 RepID=A0A1B0BLZ5_9MUSC
MSVFQNLDFHTFSIILMAYCTHYEPILAGAYCVYQKFHNKIVCISIELDFTRCTTRNIDINMNKRSVGGRYENSCFICVKHLLLVRFGWMADLVCIRRRHLNKNKLENFIHCKANLGCPSPN